MLKARVGVGLAAGLLLLCIGVSPAWAAPTVAQMLSYKPRQEGVVISTPTEAEQKLCEVKLVTGSRAGSSGWLLLDAGRKPLRRFFDSDGDKKIDLWSYYKDGVEVYREIDTNHNDRADQYRWFHGAGMKWGIDVNEDGKIDGWKMISAEEAAQEAFQAVATRDYARLQALFISEAEVRALKLPAAMVEQIGKLQKQAPAKFESTAAKLAALVDKTQHGRVESAPPQCVPADVAGTEQDLLKYPSRTILYEISPKQHEWLQTGEMIQVGMAWRLLDAPAPGAETPEIITGGAGLRPDAELQPLMEKLTELDKVLPTQVASGKPSEEINRYIQQRVEIVEQILNKVKAPADREMWLKQLADNLSTGGQNGDKNALQKLTKLRDQVLESMPGTNLASYMTFRVLWTEYAPKLSAPGQQDLAKVQAEWMEKLSKFVQAYPKADDTPDALMHLAMGSEFSGKEDEAKRWYEQLAVNFPDSPLAAKAKGSKARLELVGNNLELAGKTLTEVPFNITNLKGKVVVVYYWASYCVACEKDFAKLKQLHTNLNTKGMELVTVNLDDRAEEANSYLQKTALPGTHLYQAAAEGGGLNSPLAVQYGINGLPNLFLVGKDGKVISRTLQVGAVLEDEVQKALEK